jgi:transcription-repair coupling factor (superfamily II helicase)
LTFWRVAKIQVEGKTQEAIKLFMPIMILYVSIHSLHKISKYNGKDGTLPKFTINRMLEDFKTKKRRASNILHST